MTDLHVGLIMAALVIAGLVMIATVAWAAYWQGHSRGVIEGYENAMNRFTEKMRRAIDKDE